MSGLEPDPYVVLGVAYDASDATIRSAWRVAVRSLHPDTCPAAADTARLDAVNAAFRQLSDRAARRRLNERRRAALYESLAYSLAHFERPGVLRPLSPDSVADLARLDHAAAIDHTAAIDPPQVAVRARRPVLSRLAVLGRGETSVVGPGPANSATPARRGVWRSRSRASVA